MVVLEHLIDVNRELAGQSEFFFVLTLDAESSRECLLKG